MYAKIAGSHSLCVGRIWRMVVKVEVRDDTGVFLKTRLQKVKELCATTPNAYWTNQYGNLDAMEAHYEFTATEICADFDSLHYAFIGAGTPRPRPPAPPLPLPDPPHLPATPPTAHA